MKPEMPHDPKRDRPTGPLIARESNARRDGLWTRLRQRLSVSRSRTPARDSKITDARERLPLPIFPF
jgi:hypothetical protein